MESTLLNYGDGPRAIYEVLKKRIVSGELEAGAELKIMPLANELGVSIVPVREAIRMLAAEDLVELRPRRSPIITTLHQGDLVEINRIRSLLEPFVLEDAISAHMETTLATCEAILQRESVCEDLWEKVELNQQFHMALLKPSSFRRTIDMIADQYVGMARIIHYRLVNHLAGDPEMVDKPHSEHEEIFKAVKIGDAAGALELMTLHIDKATKRARELFDSPEAANDPSRTTRAL